jgi:hypothetical protein
MQQIAMSWLVYRLTGSAFLLGLVGPSLAGITVAFLGEGICFLLNALSFFAIVVALSLMTMLVRFTWIGPLLPLFDLHLQALRAFYERTPLRPRWCRQKTECGMPHLTQKIWNRKA